MVAAPKFYFGDVGVVNFLARRGALQPGGELFGKAFENWVFHELCCYNSYRARYADFFYWRLSSGIEVDFVVNHIVCAVEAKAVSRVRADHAKGLRELKADHPETGRTHRRVAGPARPHHRRRHRTAPLHHIPAATLAGRVFLKFERGQPGQWCLGRA